MSNRRSVPGINAPYRVIFPVPDGSIASNSQGSDFRQVGYSYRNFPVSQNAGGTLYIDSASIVGFLRTSPAAGLTINSSSNIPSTFVISDNAAILINSISNTFYSWQTSSSSSLNINSNSNIFSNFQTSLQGGINSSNNLNLFTQFLNSTLGQNLLNISVDISNKYGIDAANSLAFSNSINLLGILRTGPESSVQGSLIAECSSTLNFMSSFIAGVAISSQIGMREELRTSPLPALNISSVIPISSEIRTNASGGLKYTENTNLPAKFATSNNTSILINAVLGASLLFNQQSAGKLNLSSEVYFINRFVTENNIKASIVGAIDMAGTLHLFLESPEITGNEQFYIADFILRRKSLEELNLYRLSLSHSNLYIQQTSIKDLNIDQVRSYIVSIEEVGLFEVNRRI